MKRVILLVCFLFAILLNASFVLGDVFEDLTLIDDFNDNDFNTSKWTNATISSNVGWHKEEVGTLDSYQDGDADGDARIINSTALYKNATWIVNLTDRTTHGYTAFGIGNGSFTGNWYASLAYGYLVDIQEAGVSIYKDVFDGGGVNRITGIYAMDTANNIKNITLAYNSSGVFLYINGSLVLSSTDTNYTQGMSVWWYVGSYTDRPNRNRVDAVYYKVPPPINVAPIITWETLTPLNNTFQGTDPIVFYFNVSDADGDSVNCSLLRNSTVNVTKEDPAQNITTEHIDYSPSESEEATWNFTINCTDGIDMTFSSSKIIHVDLKNPVLYWTYPKSDNTTQTNESFNLSIAAVNTHLESMEYNISYPNGSVIYTNYTDGFYALGQKYASFNDTIPIKEDGHENGTTYTIQFKACDKADNCKEEFITFVFGVVPPPPIPSNLTCLYNEKPYIKDQISWLCSINNSNENSTWNCLSYVYYGLDLIQSNPERQSITGIGLYDSFKAKPENSSFRSTHILFSSKDLRDDKSVMFKVICSNGTSQLTFEANVTPTYKDPYEIIDIGGFVIKQSGYYTLPLIWLVVFLVVLIIVLAFVAKWLREHIFT